MILIHLFISRYLAERLERVQAEKDLANKMGRRYKEALEASKRIVSKEGNREHLKKLLENATFPVPQPSTDKTQNNIFYLYVKRSISVDIDSACGLSNLCMSLLETLSDRQIQIRHQRAANKELADKLERLQDRLLSVEGGEILVFPSQVTNCCQKDRVSIALHC